MALSENPSCIETSTFPSEVIDLTTSPLSLVPVLTERQLNRPCDNAHCIKCCLPIKPDEDSGIGLTMPSKAYKRLTTKEKGQLTLTWNVRKRVNYLHEICWDKCWEDSLLSRPDKKLLGPILDSVERYSNIAAVREQVSKVVPLLLSSRSTICFTGSGISASAGLYTYRGAGGIDELEAHAEDVDKNSDDEEEDEPG